MQRKNKNRSSYDYEDNDDFRKSDFKNTQLYETNILNDKKIENKKEETTDNSLNHNKIFNNGNPIGLKIIGTRIPKYPKFRNHRHWEHSFYKQLNDLYSIFIEGISKIDQKLYFKLMNNKVEAFDVFTDFIFQFSSGEISEYLEYLSSDSEDKYFEYDIKRNDIL